MSANNVENIFTWYFRFNGYFTTPNFTVHKDYKKKPGGGEADLLAVRFPYSKEEPKKYPFHRDETLIVKDKIDFIIAEMKSSICDINPSWLNKEYRNIEYAIRWIGFLADEKEIAIAAQEIYNTSVWQPDGGNIVVRMVACGNETNERLTKLLPI